MQESYLKEQGLYYKTNTFESNRLTLVFVHGLMGSSSAWLPYEKIFENKYNLLTFDIRGHGKSKKFPNYSDYEIKNFADDLHNLITHLGISKFILVSHSFGSLIALEYLKTWQESVTACVFNSPEIYLYENFITKIIRSTLGILTGILCILPFNLKPRGHVDYNKHKNSTDWNIKRNLADIKNTGLHSHLYALRQSLNQKLEHFLEKINMPTLIIHGEKDSLVPFKNAIAMSKKIKNSEFVSIQNIDHQTVHNAPKIISGAIESFIAKNKKNLLY